jgi:hypothetical protein
MLVNEGDTLIGKYIDAPKVLGDIFEAVIGAVYLDSKCLLTAWKVLYRLIHNEISQNHFSTYLFYFCCVCVLSIVRYKYIKHLVIIVVLNKRELRSVQYYKRELLSQMEAKNGN